MYKNNFNDVMPESDIWGYMSPTTVRKNLEVWKRPQPSVKHRQLRSIVSVFSHVALISKTFASFYYKDSPVLKKDHVSSAEIPL